MVLKRDCNFKLMLSHIVGNELESGEIQGL